MRQDKKKKTDENYRKNFLWWFGCELQQRKMIVLDSIRLFYRHIYAFSPCNNSRAAALVANEREYTRRHESHSLRYRWYSFIIHTFLMHEMSTKSNDYGNDNNDRMQDNKTLCIILCRRSFCCVVSLACCCALLFVCRFLLFIDVFLDSFFSPLWFCDELSACRWRRHCYYCAHAHRLTSKTTIRCGSFWLNR